MASSGPIIFEAQGDAFIDPGCIGTVIWEGVTVSGDRAEISKFEGGVIWAARTGQTQTYIGANLGPSGVSCIKGFHCSALSNGRLLIYLRED